MKTINLTHASPEFAELLEHARDEDLIVRLADGSEFLLVAVDDFGDEVARSRLNPKLIAFLETRASQTESVPLDEVQRRLNL